MELLEFDVEIENYGQFLDLQKPKRIDQFKILCHCPKCNKLHIRTYKNLRTSKEYIYCNAHKRIRSFEAKYGPGVKGPAGIPSVKAKIAATKAEKYGEDWGQKWYEEQKQRMLNTIGVENAGLARDHAIKSFNSMIERYGSTEKAYAIRQKHIEETASEEYGSYERYTKMRLNSQLESLRIQYGDSTITSINNIPPLKEKRFNEYLDALQYFPNVKVTYKNDMYNFKCSICGQETPITYDSRIYHCPNCNKFVKPSGQISAIQSFIEKLGVKTELNYRDNFSNYTFDIFIPEKNVGIDLISTATHSNIGYYDLQEKALDCEKFGITLVCLMEDYWYTKSEVVKSNLKNILGLFSEPIDAFNCSIREIDVDLYTAFCEDNHLWGKCSASLKLGMFHNGVLVAIAGLAVPRYLKEYDYEILRYCWKTNVYIENGLHAIIKWMATMHPNESIIYYHDLRWPDNTENAMVYFKETDPSIYYWKGDGRLESWSLNKRTWIENKADFDFNHDLSVRLNMLKEGYNIMYDCGYRIYIYD